MKHLKKILIVLGVFLAVYAAYFVSKGFSFYKGIYTRNPVTQKKTAEQKTVYNILLMGYGGPGHDGPYLTDSMMVAHVDLKTNKVALISLPRDIWVKLPTKSKVEFHSKINAIYQTGLFPENYPDVVNPLPEGADLAKRGISYVVGFPIDAFVAIDFEGFTKAVDILGGVDVQVLKTFDDYEYPIDGKEKELCGKDAEFEQVKAFLEPGFDPGQRDQLFKDKPELEVFFKSITEDPKVAFPCRYEHLHFDAGKVHMDGATALKYTRSRHSLQDGSDFGRAARQQQFVKAVKDKVVNVGFVTKVIPLLDEMKKHIKTDISPDDIKKFIAEAPDAGSYRIINIRMSDSDYLASGYSDYGGYILVPKEGTDKWGAVQTMIKNSIAEITPTPTPAPTQKITPTGKAAQNPKVKTQN